MVVMTSNGSNEVKLRQGKLEMGYYYTSHTLSVESKLGANSPENSRLNKRRAVAYFFQDRLVYPTQRALFR